jgi:hypothetical protein
MDEHVQMVHCWLAESFCNLRRIKCLEMLRFQRFTGHLAERRQQIFAVVMTISLPRARSNLDTQEVEPTREVLLNTLAVGHDEQTLVTIACHFCEFASSFLASPTIVTRTLPTVERDSCLP